jgi:hypothetical protein
MAADAAGRAARGKVIFPKSETNGSSFPHSIVSRSKDQFPWLINRTARAPYFWGSWRMHPRTSGRRFSPQECGSDSELRKEVGQLLAAQEEIGSFMNRPAADGVVTIVRLISEQPGTVIGPCKLLQQIGEGEWVSSSWPSKSDQ